MSVLKPLITRPAMQWRRRALVVLMLFALPILAEPAAAPAQAVAGRQAAPPIPRESTPEGARRQILQTIDRFFGALARLDQQTASSLLLPSGMLIFENRTTQGSYALHEQSNAKWLALLPAWRGNPRELPSRSKVMIWGPIATVSHQYVFELNGKTDHCGTNLLQMVKEGPDWKIANIVWTAEHDCRNNH